MVIVYFLLPPVKMVPASGVSATWRRPGACGGRIYGKD